MAYIDKYGVEFSDDRKTLVKCPEDFHGAYTIPDGVEIIKRDSFQGCSELTALSIPMSVNKVEQFAIRSCDKLTSLVIPDSITEIGNGNFYNLENLRSIVIGNGVHYLENCFGSCGSLTSIIVNDKLRLSLINDDLFETPWYQLHPEGAVIIGATLIKYKLSTDEQLKEYIVPDNVLYIAEGAFDDCKNLESIDFNNVHVSECKLPNNVSQIIVSGDSMQKIDSIDNTIWYSNQNEGLVYLGSLLYKYKIKADFFPRIIKLAPNTTVINKQAFYALGYDQEDQSFVVISNETLTTVGESAFEGSAISEIILSKGLRTIQNKAFSNSLLNSINLPESVEKIGEEAFAECKLTSIHIPASITNIPKRAFWRNHSLVNVSLSPFLPGVKEIEEDAFAECDIRSVYLPDSIRRIEYGAFSNNRALKSVFLSKDAETIYYDDLPLKRL